MNMGEEIWVLGESFAAPCVVMSGSGSDQHKLKSVACTQESRYACIKPCRFLSFCSMYYSYVINVVFSVCPTGATLFGGKGCIKIETSPKNKADAETNCKSIDKNARLLSIKNSYEQKELENILKKNSITDDILLGASKDGTQWLWSDGAPVFVTCKFKYLETENYC